MRAIVGDALGAPDSLVMREMEAPQIGEGQIRIGVRAAGVNFADVLFAAGQYQVRPVPPFTPGFEVSGVVVETKSPLHKVGARVVAMVRAGGYASEVAAAGAHAWEIPASLPFEEAAGFMITYQTSWMALHRRAALQAGETLLVHAGAGGVGSAAIQLGKAAGARVIATAGGPAKVKLCKELGADVVIDYKADDFTKVVKAETSGAGADVIFDPVGGEIYEKSTKCIAFEGRIVIVGFTSGVIPSAKLNHALVKNYSILGLHWWLYQDKKPALVTQSQQALYALYEAGKIKPLITEVLPLERAADAMNKVYARESTGKIVLVP